MSAGYRLFDRTRAHYLLLTSLLTTIKNTDYV
jgi:hypothetical protein